jgi:hypothetical protein
MASTSLARSGQETTTDTRVARGLELYRHHAEDFLYRNGVWIIASDTLAGRAYEVNLARESCECADHQHRGAVCKHIVAATLANSKSSLCSCCGHRVLKRSLSEVVEEDELLSWFVGDQLCADCVRAGYWA